MVIRFKHVHTSQSVVNKDVELTSLKNYIDHIYDLDGQHA
ncbi:unnamed protein product, partial [Rotaria sp. Silwood2]